MYENQLDDAMDMRRRAASTTSWHRRFEGKAAIRGFLTSLHAASPDPWVQPSERIFSDDSTALVQWWASGDFTGDPSTESSHRRHGVEIVAST